VLTTAVILLLAAPAGEAPTKLEPPKVILLSVGKDGSLTFEVSNPNAEPLPFVGYLPSSFEGGLKEGTISPIYRIELLHGREWKDKKIGWCGTGIGPVSIPAKGKVTFQMLLPDGEWDEFRVGLTWYTTANRKEHAVIWSDGLSRKAIEAKKR
jgi:hypothetical protein